MHALHRLDDVLPVASASRATSWKELLDNDTLHMLASVICKKHLRHAEPLPREVREQVELPFQRWRRPRRVSNDELRVAFACKKSGAARATGETLDELEVRPTRYVRMVGDPRRVSVCVVCVITAGISRHLTLLPNTSAHNKRTTVER